VHGAAVLTGWADPRRSLYDLIYQCVASALADANMTMAQVDSVVLASHDLVDGRSLSSMVTAPAAGAYLRDEIRLAHDSLAAASLGAARIEAGESEVTVLASWGRASEGDFRRTSQAAFDPFLLQPLQLDEFSVSALRLSAWLARHPRKDDARRLALQSRTRRAQSNPRALRQGSPLAGVCYPVRSDEAPKMADVVAAAILSPRESAVRVAGTGHSTDLPLIGDRDLMRMPSLREAADRALSVASTKIECIEVFELSAATLFDEAFALETLGVAEPGEGFLAYASSTRFNPSGGGARGWCFPAMGLSGLAECYLQLTGRAGGVQQSKRPRTALATSCSPVGAQTHTAVVLEAS
jgi:acetyl-CoA C-acetyltransferase